MCKISDFEVHFYVISGKINGFSGLVFRLVLIGFDCFLGGGDIRFDIDPIPNTKYRTTTCLLGL